MNGKDFNFEEFEKEAIKQIKSGKKLEGRDGVLAPLLQRLLNASLNGELDAHIIEKPLGNRKNGKGKKKVKTSFGEIELESPRDRNDSEAAHKFVINYKDKAIYIKPEINTLSFSAHMFGENRVIWIDWHYRNDIGNIHLKAFQYFFPVLHEYNTDIEFSTR